MILEKDDLKQIRGIIREEVGETIDKKVPPIVDKIVDKKVRDSQRDIITILTREIDDLSEINREVIDKVEEIDELKARIIRLETQTGLM